MKSMNLFSDTGAKSSEALFGSNTTKENTNQLTPAPIQNEEGNLIFCLEGRTYSLNVNYKEERERVKEEINVNSLTKYDWFKEETGKNHWVLYNTKMYEVEKIYLHYKEDSNLVPIIPINATSCYDMFYGCKSLTQLNLSNFDTSQVINMSGIFSACTALTQLNLSSFDTSKVTAMGGMFNCCYKLTQLDLSSFDTSKVVYMDNMFSYCKSLTQLDLSNFDTSEVYRMDDIFYDCQKLNIIYISAKWNINSINYSDDMFNGCRFLPNFNPEKTDAKMAKPVEQGGYLILI